MFVASAAYFNDWVVVQTQLVGNHLPIGVFGVLLLLLLVVNPLLCAAGRRWMLGPRELAIIAALGLMACVWAGSNFYRTFVTNMVFPANDVRSNAAWRSAQVMSYLPGGSARIASGHVTRWTDLLAILERARTAPGTPIERAIAAQLSEEDHLLIRQAVDASQLEPSVRGRLLALVNDALIEPTSAAKAGGEPLYTMLAPGVSEAAGAALGRRDRARAAADALRVERSAAEADLAEARGRFAGQLEALTAEEQRLGERIAAINVGSADATDRTAERQRLEDRREQVRGELGRIKAELAPEVRRVQRLGWQIDYYASKAVRAEQRANRAAVVSMTDGLILPAPEGEGVYLNDGVMDAFASEVLVQGWDGDRPLGLRDLGWWAWWPTFRAWGSVAVLLTLAMFCLSMIVHPQWSRRELLSYPIVRFVEAASEPGRGALPKVMASRLFWIGFLVVLAVHTWNGINTWYPGYLKAIPLNIDLAPARALFENVVKTPTSWMLFSPIIYASVVGFAYFLNKEVSLSMGLALPTWGAFGGLLVSNGVAIENGWYNPAMMSMFRFGAYLGMCLIVLYVGRRYYANVMLSALGAPRAGDTPAYAAWAMRGLAVFVVLAGWALNAYVGMDWLLAMLFMGVFLVMSLGMARISAETGAFFAQPSFMAVAVLTALFGLSALGPEAYFALAIASAVMMNDPRESAMPFFVNALNLGDRVGKASPGRTALPLATVLVVTFAVAGAATLYWQYAKGAGSTDSFARKVSSESPNRVEQTVTALAARGELVSSLQVHGLGRLAAARPDAAAIGWIAGGVGIVLLFAFLRLRLSWWPLHPVMFLLWGTYPLVHLWFSFLLGWLIKFAVTKLAGVKGYREAIPLMVGLVAGELLAAFGWTVAGAASYFITGHTPVMFRILPG